MKTRVNKYYEESSKEAPRRTTKNTELYEEIKKSEIENFDIGSNAKVIGNNEAQIDINKLKDILEKNYQEVPKRRSLKLDKIEEEEIELEKTREYDINAILEKARAEKEEDYQSERLKKIRDTQYDILKTLEDPQEDVKKSASEKAKEELLDLIQTINLNETQSKTLKALAKEEPPREEVEDEEADLDPLDILQELKGDENTVVAGAKEMEEKLEEAKKKQEKEEINEALDEDLDNSFYTNSLSFSKNDFATFDDIEDGKGKIVIRILIFLIVIAIIAGLVIFLNDFLNLGWF